MGFITKAVRINSANQITDGVITGAKLANDTITAEKIGVLDYVRALQYDVYNDAKTAIKARIDHDEATSYARFLAGADVATLDSVFYIETHIMPKGFVFGAKVDVVFCGNKRLAEVGAPLFQGDALRFGQAEITNNEISPTANIAKSKLAVGAPQRVTGQITAPTEGDFDITALLTPSSYPALVIGFGYISGYSSPGTDQLMISDSANNILDSTLYASIDDSGVKENIVDGFINSVSTLISSGSVKLRHHRGTGSFNRTINGVLLVIEL